MPAAPHRHTCLDPLDTIRLAPGGPFDLERPLAPAAMENLRRVYGLDQPLIVQYVKSIAGFLAGDFGYSVASGAAVSDLIATALPATLTLAVLGLGLAIFLGVVIAEIVTRIARGA